MKGVFTMPYEPVTQADMLAYNVLINESETKQELRENLQYISDDLKSKYYDDSEEGGPTLKLSK